MIKDNTEKQVVSTLRRITIDNVGISLNLRYFRWPLRDKAIYIRLVLSK